MAEVVDTLVTMAGQLGAIVGMYVGIALLWMAIMMPLFWVTLKLSAQMSKLFRRRNRLRR
jgi:hypothetical protein